MSVAESEELTTVSTGDFGVGEQWKSIQLCDLQANGEKKRVITSSCRLYIGAAEAGSVRLRDSVLRRLKPEKVRDVASMFQSWLTNC